MPKKSNWNRIWVPSLAAALGVVITSIALGILRSIGILPSAVYDLYDSASASVINETVSSGINIIYWITLPFRFIWDMFIIGMGMIANIMFGW